MQEDHDRSFHTPRNSVLLPMLLVLAPGGLLACVFWTVPTVGLVEHMGQLPVYWQLIILTKVASPLLVMCFLAGCVLLWHLIQPYLGAAEQDPPARATQPGQRPPGSPALHEAHAVAHHASDHTNVLVEQGVEASQQSADDSPGRSAALIPVAQSPSSPQADETTPGGNGTDQPPLTLTLLKEVTLTVQAPDGRRWTVPLSPNAKRVQLLAYIACMQGKSVRRDTMLEQVFGHGHRDEEATVDKLGEAFDSHRKLMRADVRQAILSLNAQAGREVLPPDLDIFAHQRRLWWLSPLCRVVDLATIEEHHQVIEQARKDGLLDTAIPEQVKVACDRLIAAYVGDFLATIIHTVPDDFKAWNGRSSWARKPFTRYRDYYLQALWYAAVYEQQAGQRIVPEDEESRTRQQAHFGRAADRYRTYSEYACNARFDEQVFVDPTGNAHGERVLMSERALRRCLVLYGRMEQTQEVDTVYNTYARQMNRLFRAWGRTWEPGQDTLEDLRLAKQQTGVYRFAIANAQAARAE